MDFGLPVGLGRARAVSEFDLNRRLGEQRYRQVRNPVFDRTGNVRRDILRFERKRATVEAFTDQSRVVRRGLAGIGELVVVVRELTVVELRFNR